MAKRQRDIPCKFYSENRCSKGDECEFRHDMDVGVAIGMDPAAKKQKGGKGDAKGKSDGKGGGKSHGKVDRRCGCAFKVLFPDAHVVCVIGAGGSMRQEIEAECHVHIQISARDLFYPGTTCRMLTLTADASSNIVHTLERIIERMVDKHETDERKGKGKGKDDEDPIVGKAHGEYVFRVAMPSQATGRLMGEGGCTIKRIREQAGVKMIVEPGHCGPHQLLKIIGSPDCLRAALPEVVTVIEQEMSQEDLQDWAGDMTVSEGGNTEGFAKAGGKGKNGKDKDRDRDHGRREDARETGGDEHWDESWSGATLEGMMQVRDEFPEDTLDMDYEINCELPNERIGSLIGARGENAHWVENTTGAKVKFSEREEGSAEENRTMTISGPLIGVYMAHMLMMKQYHVSEQEAIKKDKRKELEAKLAELQAQLKEVSK